EHTRCVAPPAARSDRCAGCGGQGARGRRANARREGLRGALEVQALAAVRRAPAVVVGSGLAGLSAALGLEGCVLLTRGSLGSGSSGHAQGGIAAALGPDDEAAAHAADTLAVAGGLG